MMSVALNARKGRMGSILDGFFSHLTINSQKRDPAMIILLMASFVNMVAI